MATSFPAAGARPIRPGGVVLPLLLILAGVVFLLRNYGLLPLRFWPAVAHLWPLLLVLIGVELLVAGRLGTAARLATLLVVLVVGVAAVAAIDLARSVMAGPAETTTLAQPLEGATQATVRLTFGAGHFEVGALPPGGDRLAAGTFDGPAGVQPVPRYRVRDGVGNFTYGLRGDDQPGVGFPFVGADQALTSMNVQLSPDLPIVLEAKLGAADSRLDMSGLKLTRVDLETGASRTWLRLPQAAGLTSGRVRAGAASLDIEVPPGVAAQIDFQGGMSNVDVDEGRFPLIGEGSRGLRRWPRALMPPTPPPPGRDGIDPAAPPGPSTSSSLFGGSRLYRSADYETAANKVDLVVEAGASSVTIR